MATSSIEKFGKLTPVISLLIGAALIGIFVTSPDNDFGKFIYYYIIAADIVNSIALLVVLAACIFTKGPKKKLIITCVVILICFAALFSISFYVY